MYATSVGLNPSSSATCVIAGSVTTTTSKLISFCMRDDHFCSEFVNGFTDCNNHFTLCMYNVQFIVWTMLFTSIPLCIIFPAAYPMCLCLWQQFQWEDNLTVPRTRTATTTNKRKNTKHHVLCYFVLVFQISLCHTSILRQSFPCACHEGR